MAEVQEYVSYIMIGDKIYPINVERINQNFVDIVNSNNIFNIDYLQTPFANITLLDNINVNFVNILNTSNGSSGSILIHQSGECKLEFQNVVGEVKMPSTTGAVVRVDYTNINGTIYLSHKVIQGDTVFENPDPITDLAVSYVDGIGFGLSWTSKPANGVSDTPSYYVIKYSTSDISSQLVDGNGNVVESEWEKMIELNNHISPKNPALPDHRENYNAVNLLRGKYYVYVRQVAINYGKAYYSNLSNCVNVTIETPDIESRTPNRIALDNDMVYASRDNLIAESPAGVLYNILDDDGTVYNNGGADDDDEGIGYVNTNKFFNTTKWNLYPYSRYFPIELTFDLNSVYLMDRIYFAFNKGNNNRSIYVYTKVGNGDKWNCVGHCTPSEDGSGMGPQWRWISFNEIEARYIRVSFQRSEFVSLTAVAGADGYFHSDVDAERLGIPTLAVDCTNEANGYSPCYGMILYGWPKSQIPSRYTPPKRDASAKYTFDEFFQTNGNWFNAGYLHSLCGGSTPRLFGAFGHFAAHYMINNNQPDPNRYTSIKDIKFNLDAIDWVRGNSGGGLNFKNHLIKYYRDFGMYPIITASSNFDYCRYYDYFFGNSRKQSTNRCLDIYWVDSLKHLATTTVPSSRPGSVAAYYNITADPQYYKTYAKLCMALALKYGGVKNDALMETLEIETSPSLGESGLNLISGIEDENEPDMTTRSTWIDVDAPSEYYARTEASADGLGNRLVDEDGNVLKGIHIDPNMKAIAAGYAGVGAGYTMSGIQHILGYRANTLGSDVFNIHCYPSSSSLDGFPADGNQHAVPYDVWSDMESSSVNHPRKLAEFRNKYFPNKETWVTEFGIGEKGILNGTKNTYQIAHQSGNTNYGFLIPDRFAGDIKGAWIIRGAIWMQHQNINKMFYYQTFDEVAAFTAADGLNQVQWRWNYTLASQGNGNAITDISQYSNTTSDFQGPKTYALFGHILDNGGYPIRHAFWWVSTYRYRLKGFTFMGIKYFNDDRKVTTAYYHNFTTNKSAYVIWYRDDDNTGKANVSIPFSNEITSVKHISVYIPDTPNPYDVPGDLGKFRSRQGLPAAAHYIYTNGEWVRDDILTYFDVQDMTEEGEEYVYSNHDYAFTARTPEFPSNPVEGQKYTILPTPAENPYFPIVGPVATGVLTSERNNLKSTQFERKEKGEWVVKTDVHLSLRQQRAIYDFIVETNEGRLGSMGIEDDINISNTENKLTINITTFPELYIFDGLGDYDYEGEVTMVDAITISESSIRLFWNNTNPHDESYDIFYAQNEPSNFTLLRNISAGASNIYTVENLDDDTIYYFKMRPRIGDKVGEFSNYVYATTFKNIKPIEELAISNFTYNSVTLNWAYSQGDANKFTSYRIYRSANGGLYSIIDDITNFNTNQYVDNTAVSGTSYMYKVVVVYGDYNSTESNTVQVSTPVPSVSYMNVISANANSGNAITVTFDCAFSESYTIPVTVTINGNSENINVNTTNDIVMTINMPAAITLTYDDVISISWSENSSVVSTTNAILPAVNNLVVTNNITRPMVVTRVINTNFNSTGTGGFATSTGLSTAGAAAGIYSATTSSEPYGQISLTDSSVDDIKISGLPATTGYEFFSGNSDFVNKINTWDNFLTIQQHMLRVADLMPGSYESETIRSATEMDNLRSTDAWYILEHGLTSANHGGNMSCRFRLSGLKTDCKYIIDLLSYNTNHEQFNKKPLMLDIWFEATCVDGDEHYFESNPAYNTGAFYTLGSINNPVKPLSDGTLDVVINKYNPSDLSCPIFLQFMRITELGYPTSGGTVTWSTLSGTTSGEVYTFTLSGSEIPANAKDIRTTLILNGHLVDTVSGEHQHSLTGSMGGGSYVILTSSSLNVHYLNTFTVNAGSSQISFNMTGLLSSVVTSASIIITYDL